MRYNLSEHNFEKCLALKKKRKTSDDLPDLEIDGAALGYTNKVLVKLPIEDDNAFVLGHMTRNCQSIGAQSENCVIDGITKKKNGFYVLLTRKKEEYIPPNTPKKARSEITAKNTERANALPMVDGKINYKHFTLSGQGYAWLSGAGNMTFDSWENENKDADDAVIVPLLTEFAKQVVAADNDIVRVTIGTGGRTPEAFNDIVEVPEVQAEGIQYTIDSAQQALIYENKEKLRAKFDFDAFIQDLKAEHPMKKNAAEIKSALHSIYQAEELINLHRNKPEGDWIFDKPELVSLPLFLSAPVLTFLNSSYEYGILDKEILAECIQKPDRMRLAKALMVLLQTEGKLTQSNFVELYHLSNLMNFLPLLKKEVLNEYIDVGSQYGLITAETLKILYLFFQLEVPYHNTNVQALGVDTTLLIKKLQTLILEEKNQRELSFLCFLFPVVSLFLNQERLQILDLTNDINEFDIKSIRAKNEEAFQGFSNMQCIMSLLLEYPIPNLLDGVELYQVCDLIKQMASYREKKFSTLLSTLNQHALLNNRTFKQLLAFIEESGGFDLSDLVATVEKLIEMDKFSAEYQDDINIIIMLANFEEVRPYLSDSPNKLLNIRDQYGNEVYQIMLQHPATVVTLLEVAKILQKGTLLKPEYFSIIAEATGYETSIATSLVLLKEQRLEKYIEKILSAPCNAQFNARILILFNALGLQVDELLPLVFVNDGLTPLYVDYFLNEMMTVVSPTPWITTPIMARMIQSGKLLLYLEMLTLYFQHDLLSEGSVEFLLRNEENLEGLSGLLENVNETITLNTLLETEALYCYRDNMISIFSCLQAGDIEMPYSAVLEFGDALPKIDSCLRLLERYTLLERYGELILNQVDNINAIQKEMKEIVKNNFITTRANPRLETYLENLKSAYENSDPGLSGYTAK